MITSAMKKRAIEEIKADIAEREARLSELKEKGDAACSAYDLSLGYTAEWYLESGMIENQIRYFEQELRDATNGMLFW